MTATASARDPNVQRSMPGYGGGCAVWLGAVEDGAPARNGLCRLGVAKLAAFAATQAAKGPRRLSSSRALHDAFSKTRFRVMGLVEMARFVKA